MLFRSLSWCCSYVFGVCSFQDLGFFFSLLPPSVWLFTAPSPERASGQHSPSDPRTYFPFHLPSPGEPGPAVCAKRLNNLNMDPTSIPKSPRAQQKKGLWCPLGFRMSSEGGPGTTIASKIVSKRGPGDQTYLQLLLESWPRTFLCSTRNLNN